jgi:hypothetical protein
MEGIVKWSGTYYLQQACSVQIGFTLEDKQTLNKVTNRGFFSHEAGGSSTIDYRT